MDTYKEKIKFPFKCPVCGKDEFDDLTDYFKNEDDDIEVYKYDETKKEMVLITDPIEIYDVHCSHCGWTYDLKQVLDYNIIGDRNAQSVNELKNEYQNKLKANSKYDYDKEMAKPIPHKCPICGEYEFKDERSYDVCKVCGWMDDGEEEDPLGDYSEVNVMSIREAKLRFNIMRKLNPKYRYSKEKQEYQPRKIPPRDINSKMLEVIPNLKDIFIDVTELQDELDTGSTVVVEDVFMVYAKECMKNNNEEELRKCKEFLEWLSDYIDDEYAGEVLVKSIFEYIHYASDRADLENVLGPKAKSKYNSIEWL